MRPIHTGPFPLTGRDPFYLHDKKKNCNFASSTERQLFAELFSLLENDSFFDYNV